MIIVKTSISNLESRWIERGFVLQNCDTFLACVGHTVHTLYRRKLRRPTEELLLFWSFLSLKVWALKAQTVKINLQKVFLSSFL